jgi:prepilin-type N-terminal cleavage/methylation domain-containing protein
MLARIRKAMDEKEQGFTLIELLVVIIIIGILAAIAIPVFLNQRAKAIDSSMKSDARTVATEMESNFTDTQTYTAFAATATPTIGGNNVKLSTGNLAAVTVPTTGSFCVTVTRAAGAQPGTQANWVYDSDNGGLQPAGGACS